MGVDLAVDGRQGADAPATRWSTTPSRRAASTRRWSCATASWPARSCWAIPTARRRCSRRSTAPARCPTTAPSCCSRRCAAERAGLGGGAARRRADLQLQRRDEGRADDSDRRRLSQPAVALRRDPRRHRLRLVQAPGAGAARSVCRRRVADDPAAHYYVPGVPLTKPELVARDPRAQPAQRLGRLRRAGRRPRGSEEQGRPGVTAEDDLGRRVRRRARRPLHQRPRARQHPAGRHFQRHPAHLRRRHLGGAAATHRRRRRQVPGADGEDHRRPAHRPARHSEGQAARRLARPRHAVGSRLREGISHLQDLRRHRVLPLRRRRQHWPSASRSSSAFRASSRRTR